MTFNNYITIWILMIFAFITLFYIFLIKPVIKTKQSIQNKQATNDLYNIFMRIDPNSCLDYVDKFILNYVKEYVFWNITGKGDDYIKKPEIDKMNNVVTRTVILEIPELYIFYIRMVYNVTDDESLMAFVRHETEKEVLLYTTEYNNQSTD